MPEETVIVGDASGRFLCRGGDNSQYIHADMHCFGAVALVFARDKNNTHGTSWFQRIAANYILQLPHLSLQICCIWRLNARDIALYHFFLILWIFFDTSFLAFCDWPDIGEIQFHVRLSTGVIPFGPQLKAVGVVVNESLECSWLTARVEGQHGILDSEGLLSDIKDQVHCFYEMWTFKWLFWFLRYPFS